MRNTKLTKVLNTLLFTSALTLASFGAQAQEPAVLDLSSSALIEQIQKDGVLKAGVIVSPPFILQDPITNTYTGPAADFMNTAAEELGVTIEWMPVNWDTMIAGLQARHYQVLVSAVYATEARKSVVDFVNYSKSGLCYVAKVDNANANSRDDISAGNLTMIAVAGSSFATEVGGVYPNLDVTLRQLPPGGGNFYDDVLAGRYDLTMVESLMAPTVTASQPQLKVIPSVEECLADPDFPSDIGIAVNKDDQVFRKYLEGIVSSAAADIDSAVKNVTGN